MNNDYKILDSELRDIKWVVGNFGRLTKEHFTINIGSENLKFVPPRRLVISPQFFRNKNCLHCGGCCKKGTTLVYTASGIAEMQKIIEHKLVISTCNDNEIIEQLLLGLIKVDVKVFCFDNNVVNTKSFWVYNKVRNNLRCFFNKLKIDAGKSAEECLWECIIHVVKPTNCAFSLRVCDSKREDIILLTKKQYGRNWVFGCPAEFGEFNREEFEMYDLKALRSLLRIAEDLGISTFLPEIINWLESWLQSGDPVPKEPVKIYGGNVNQTRKFF